MCTSVQANIELSVAATSQNAPISRVERSGRHGQFEPLQTSTGPGHC